MCTRLEFIANCVVLFSALLVVIARDHGGISAGTAGLSVAYAMSITNLLNMSVRLASDLESMFGLNVNGEV